jgi:hypothetical protein
VTVRILVAVTVAVGMMTVPNGATASGPSNDPNGITGSSGFGKVDIDGHDVRDGRSRQPIELPVGAIRTVTCSNGRLGTVTDDPDLGAGMCAAWAPRCGLTEVTDGRRRVVVLQLIKMADGRWHYFGGGCRIVGHEITAQMVVQRAERAIPAAAIGLAPRTTTLVNTQTVMWVQTASTRTLAPVTILGRTVTITITLDHVTWSFGDGAHDTTTGPGKAYDETHDPCETPMCPHYDGHVYTITGTMTITARATWRAAFRVGTGPTQQINGTIDGPRATAHIHAKQARGVLVPNPDEH